MIAQVDDNSPLRKFEIDVETLGLEGREVLGEVKALGRWVAMFGSMRDRSDDVRERMFLAEVEAALREDLERAHVALYLASVADNLPETDPNQGELPIVQMPTPDGVQ